MPRLTDAELNSIKSRLRSRRNALTTERSAAAFATAEGPSEIDGARLVGDALHHGGKRYAINRSVTARLDSGGGQTTAQGWAIKTTQDTRQEFVVVEGDDFYIELKVWTGGSAQRISARR